MSASHAIREVIVIDPAVGDWKTLTAGLSPDIPVILLPEGGNGLSALAEALSGYGQLDALHLVSHGGAGRLNLGDLRLTSANLGEQGAALAKIASHLTTDSDLLLYGCSVAHGESGQAFVNALSASLNGADIAASTNRTGPLALGGDWNLEYAVGQIETVLPFTVQGMQGIDECLGCSVPGYVNQASCESNFGTWTPPPSPTLTSATYDANSNSLVVTGANMTTGDTINVTKLTLTGEGGNTYTLTSANVTAASATSFTVALNATDQINVEGLLNNAGTSSVGTTTYNLAGAASWDASRTTSADLTGNAITVSNVQTPTITSATYNAGVLAVTGSNLVKASGANNDITVSKLTLTGEGGSTYTLTTSNVEITDASTFSVTLNATDQAAVDQILNKSGTASTGGTTYNVAAADDWNTVITGGNIADATNAVTVSNPTTPTITSATYNAASGALVVTGSGFLKLSGTPNDIVANKFTITGEGGATYTLTDTVNVEITSGTAFTVTLSTTDLAAVNQIVNKNGTASTGATTYNLAAAEDWAAGADAAVVVADLAGNGITASNVAVPAITSATYDAGSGSLVVTGSGFLKLNGANNDIVANKLTFTGEGGATYTLTDSANVEITSGTAFTITLSTTDKAAINQMVDKNGLSSTSGTTYNLAAAEDWVAGADAAVVVADLVGNAITASNVAVPAITSATYDYSTNVLTVTGTGFLSKSGATNDIDLTKLTFTGEGGATYTLTTATGVEITSGTSFSATLSGADLINVEALLNKDGTAAVSTTTYNLSAAASWNRGDATNGSDTSNAITVSNYAAPTVTSATYDASTNVLTVTGTNLVSKSGGANDVAVSLLTLAGEGGSYALTSSDVDISNDTTVSITLNAADQLVVRGLLNKNGTASSGATTYNLAAAEDWMAGSPAATVVADLTGNGITVSNVQTPTITSATYDSTSGILAVTGTNLFKKVGASNDIDLTKLTFTGQGGGGAAYTLTNATGVEITSATSFNVTLTGADKTNVDALLNQLGTSSSDATTYNLAAADDWLTGADAATNIADAAGNGITVSINPTLSSATYNANTGVLVVTGANMQAKAGVTNDIAVSKLTLTGEGSGTYTLTTADVELDSATQFTVTLNATDKAALNQIVNKDGTSSTGATTYNIAAADDWNAQVTAGDTSDATNAVTASNVAAPVITSATYNAATGALVITGTGFLKKSGAANDIDISKLTIAGEGGSTYTLTTSSVEITNGTAFTVTLNATDLAGVNQILNKTGTSSTGGTTYNLAAAEDWAAGAAAAVNVADLTGNGITVSNPATPVITSATYDTGSGALVVTGSGFLKLSGATNDIVANKFTITGEGGGGAAYTLTDSANVEITSATSFTLTLSTTDKTGVNALLNKAGTSSTDTTTYNLAAAEDWAAGAAAAVNVADLAGNGITVTIPVSGGGGGGGTPAPATQTATVDGTTVTTTTSTSGGQTTTTQTVAPVPETRQDDPNTPHSSLADIPLVTGGGDTLLQVSLPVGVGLTSQAISGSGTLRDQLIAASNPKVTDATAFNKIVADGIDAYVPGVQDQSQVTVRTITFTETTVVPGQPIVVTGALGAGENSTLHPLRQEALVIDTRGLPAGSELKLDNVEFAIVVGAIKVTGGSGSNFIIGDNANQTFYSGDGNDVLNGGGGNDFVRGGKDSDKATFNGNSDHYKVTYEYGKTIVTSLDNPNDVVTLVNVESLQFADKTLDASSHAKDLSWIATLYQQVLGRQADLGGFQSWSQASGGGVSAGDAALSFLRSGESQQRSGVVFDQLDAAARIEYLYTQILGRQSDAAGKAYWAQQYAAGTSLSEIASHVVQSVELTGKYLAPTGWDFLV